MRCGDTELGFSFDCIHQGLVTVLNPLAARAMARHTRNSVPRGR